MSDKDLPYLAAAIKTAIDEYRRTHPDVTNEETLKALMQVADPYAKKMSDKAMEYLQGIAEDYPELAGYAKAGDDVPGPDPSPCEVCGALKWPDAECTECSHLEKVTN